MRRFGFFRLVEDVAEGEIPPRIVLIDFVKLEIIKLGFLDAEHQMSWLGVLACLPFQRP